jgi:hypothetical protein
MSVNQAKLLLALAKKIKSQPKSRNEIVASLNTAKILTKEENLTIHYSHLKKVVATAE